MLNALAVGAGGFIGAVLRYLIGLIPLKESTLFPFKTFGINLVGCLLIALIVMLCARHYLISPRWILFWKAGLCGGFTTFSTFALESVELIHTGHAGLALLYIVLSSLLGCAIILLID